MYTTLSKSAVFVVATVLPCMGALAGTITGQIVYEGDVPPVLAKPIDVRSDPNCVHHTQDSPVMNEILVLGENKEMANVIVRVTKGLPDKKWPVPENPYKMTQEGCRYSPHVNVVRLGQTLYVLNPDKIFHNVNCAPSENVPANRAMPANVSVIEFNFDKVEPVPFLFKCDVHPWMMAWCAVIDHPFYDITEKDGVYEIKELEPGEYEIEAWHERLGTQTTKVTVAGEEPVGANFTFSRESAKGE